MYNVHCTCTLRLYDYSSALITLGIPWTMQVEGFRLLLQIHKWEPGQSCCAKFDWMLLVFIYANGEATKQRATQFKPYDVVHGKESHSQWNGIVHFKLIKCIIHVLSFVCLVSSSCAVCLPYNSLMWVVRQLLFAEPFQRMSKFWKSNGNEKALCTCCEENEMARHTANN